MWRCTSYEVPCFLPSLLFLWLESIIVFTFFHFCNEIPLSPLCTHCSFVSVPVSLRRQQSGEFGMNPTVVENSLEPALLHTHNLEAVCDWWLTVGRLTKMVWSVMTVCLCLSFARNRCIVGLWHQRHLRLDLPTCYCSLPQVSAPRIRSVSPAMTFGL